MKWVVKKAAVLGAGVMGAQIAAHLANARVPVVLFDLPAKDGDKNDVVKKALDGLKRRHGREPAHLHLVEAHGLDQGGVVGGEERLHRHADIGAHVVDQRLP